MKRPIAAMLIAGFAAGWSAPALAEPDVQALLAGLDAPTLAERDAAEDTLIRARSVSLGDVESLLVRTDLSTEQRLRLEAIGREKFADVPKAGLGVRFGNPQLGADGVPLAGVVDGFPAAQVLRPGDVVISINGQRVSNTAHMGALILSHLPGETLRMEIDRPRNLNEHAAGLPPIGGDGPDGMERLAVDVPLGDYADLQTGIELTAVRLETAYRHRLARNGLLDRGRDEIGAGLTPLGWLRAEGYDADEGRAPANAMRDIDAWRMVAFGGQPRSALDDVELRRGDDNSMLRRSIRALQADGVYDEMEEALAGYRALAHRLGEVRTELTALLNATPPAEEPSPRRLESLRAESRELERSLDEILRLFRESAGS